MKYREIVESINEFKVADSKLIYADVEIKGLAPTKGYNMPDIERDEFVGAYEEMETAENVSRDKRERFKGILKERLSYLFESSMRYAAASKNVESATIKGGITEWVLEDGRIFTRERDVESVNFYDEDGEAVLRLPLSVLGDKEEALAYHSLQVSLWKSYCQSVGVQSGRSGGFYDAR